MDFRHAWKVTTGDSAVRIAVIDASFSRHPDTVGSELIEYRWTPSPFEDPNAELACCTLGVELTYRLNCMHGTAVLGTLAAAHNGYGTDGVAPLCRYLGISPATMECGPVSIDVTDEDQAEALLYAAFDWGAHIIVQTADFTLYAAGEDTLFWLTQLALDSIRQFSHAAVFFAAGNDYGPVSWYHRLARIDSSVFTIGAVDASDSIWEYSNTGPEIDFVGSAGSIDTTGDCPFDGDEPSWDIVGQGGLSPLCHAGSQCARKNDSAHFCNGGGTSLACPKVAGVAALVLSARPDFMDSADVGMALYNVLKHSAEDKGETGHDTLYGWGRVNAQRALALVMQRGDVNIDGEIDVLDVIQIVNYAFRGFTSTDYYGSLADLDCDSALTVVDVAKIIDVAFRGEQYTSVVDDCFSVYTAGLETRCDRPLLIHPNDGVELALDQDTFRWRAAPYWVTAAYFELYESGDGSPFFVDTLGVTLADTIFTYPGQLDSGAAYTWRVAFDGVDCAPALFCQEIPHSGMVSVIRCTREFGGDRVSGCEVR